MAGTDSLLSSFKTEHHYVAGLVLTAVGLCGILGSVTGTLAAMMAGLFCNSNGANTALGSTAPSSSTPSSSTPSSGTGAKGTTPTTSGVAGGTNASGGAGSNGSSTPPTPGLG